MCLQYEQFLLFPQGFLPIRRTFCHFHKIQSCCLQTLSVWKSLRFFVWEKSYIDTKNCTIFLNTILQLQILFSGTIREKKFKDKKILTKTSLPNDKISDLSKFEPYADNYKSAVFKICIRKSKKH